MNTNLAEKMLDGDAYEVAEANAKQIAELSNYNDEQDKLIFRNLAKNQEQDSRINELTSKTQIMDSLLTQQGRLFSNHDDVIKRLAVKEQECERLISELEGKNKEYEKMIEQINQRGTMHQKLISELNESKSTVTNIVNDNSRVINGIGSQVGKIREEKADKKLLVPIGIVAVLALVVAIAAIIL
ncbi:MAG: hypothetical protein IJS61_01570 [Firmicutes bacterium]|nr:hypothetical protein [Bacillota bacterium]